MKSNLNMNKILPDDINEVSLHQSNGLSNVPKPSSLRNSIHTLPNLNNNDKKSFKIDFPNVTSVQTLTDSYILVY